MDDFSYGNGQFFIKNDRFLVETDQFSSQMINLEINDQFLIENDHVWILGENGQFSMTNFYRDYSIW